MLIRLIMDKILLDYQAPSDVEVKVEVCVPIKAGSIADTLIMLRKAEDSGADLIEIRLDYANLGFSEIVKLLNNVVKQCSTPLIATNRQRRQGGKCNLSEGKRIKTLISAAEAGFTYVDIELTTQRLEEVVKEIKARGAETIVSFHDFNHTPSIGDMKKIVEAQINAGADLCKFVTMAKNISDSIKSLLFTHEMSKKTGIICFAMGKYGLLSRVLSPLFGASFTYASLGEGLETAPGQISIYELREIYRKFGV